jgi:hypothetical protein
VSVDVAGEPVEPPVAPSAAGPVDPKSLLINNPLFESAPARRK